MLINYKPLYKTMTRKLILGAIVAVVFSLGILGTLNLGTNTDNVKTADVDVSQNHATSIMAFADKPVKLNIPINVNPDYGSTSSFTIEDVECQTSTKDGETKVDWCKATAIMDKTELEFLIQGGFSSIENLEVLIAAIEANPLDFDMILVEYEIGLLLKTMMA